jgi:hypothetical protein
MKKREKKTVSTHASKRLAALFEERDGAPEFHKLEIKHLPEEKFFTKDAKF